MPIRTKHCWASFLVLIPTKNKAIFALLLNKNNAMPKGNPNKSYLPTKNCVVCNRPFTWRKKWEKNWDEVKYCSDKCRSNKITPLAPKGE